jgi:basic membrane lipoprotein Med (substrate-binding protein (PBP1-ABC) superfamily)
MKKVFFTLTAIAVIGLTSCGDKDKEKEASGPTVCDCVKMGEEAEKEYRNAGDDEEKLKQIDEKYNKKYKECDELVKGKSDEELTKLMEEAEKCK